MLNIGPTPRIVFQLNCGLLLGKDLGLSPLIVKLDATAVVHFLKGVLDFKHSIMPNKSQNT